MFLEQKLLHQGVKKQTKKVDEAISSKTNWLTWENLSTDNLRKPVIVFHKHFTSVIYSRNKRRKLV